MEWRDLHRMSLPFDLLQGRKGGADDDNNLTPLSALTSHLRLLQQSPLRSGHDNNNDTIVSSDYEKRGLRMMRLQ